jgi:hypothetical protein
LYRPVSGSRLDCAKSSSFFCASSTVDARSLRYSTATTANDSASTAARIQLSRWRNAWFSSAASLTSFSRSSSPISRRRFSDSYFSCTSSSMRWRDCSAISSRSARSRW